MLGLGLGLDDYPNHGGLLADCCRPSHVPDRPRHIGNIELMIHRCIADNHNVSPFVADLAQKWCPEHSQIANNRR